jgi:hypothetical protein
MMHCVVTLTHSFSYTYLCFLILCYTALLVALDTTDAEIQVTEWRPAKFMRKGDKPHPGGEEEGGGSTDGDEDEDAEGDAEQAAILIKEQVQRQLEQKELIDTNLDLYPTKADQEKKHRNKTLSGPLALVSNTERFTLNLDQIGEDDSAHGGAAFNAGATTQTTAPGFERPGAGGAHTFSGAVNYTSVVGAGAGAGASTSSTNGFGLQRRPTATARRSQRQKQVSTPYTARRSMWDTDEAAQQAAFEGVEATAATIPEAVGSVDSGPGYGGARLQRNQTSSPRRRKMKSDLLMNSIMEEMPTVEERLGGIVRQELTLDSVTGQPIPLSRTRNKRQSSLGNLFSSIAKQSEAGPPSSKQA